MTDDGTVPERHSLVIRRVGIERMAGIDRPFGIDRLSPGINVIHGPNAIGKSRTSKAIQALVWPELAADGSVIRGELAVADSSWEVETHYGRVLHQRHGETIAAPAFGISPANQHDRYLLTLHDLLAADDRQNQEFAAVIQRESAGGYDLNAVRAATGLATAPKAAPGRFRNAHQDARTVTSALKRADQALQARDRDRDRLVEERAAADEAVARVGLLEAALEHAAAVARRTVAAIARDAFADPIGRMAGDEFERLQGLRQRVADLQRQRDGLTTGIARHERALADAGFPRGLPDEADLHRLASLTASLGQVEREREAAAADLAEATARVRHQRQRLGNGLTEEQLAALDLTGLRELGSLARRFREAEHRVAAQAELAAWVGPLDVPANLDALRRGAEGLGRRLRLAGSEAASPREARLRWAVIAAALVIVLAAIALAVVSIIAWAALGLLAIPLLWLAFQADRSGAAEEARGVETAYLALGLDPPAAWTPEHVEPLLDQLQERLAAASVQQEKATVWNGLAQRRADAGQMRKDLATRQAAQIETLGLTIGSDEPDEIRLVADAIDRWRQASDELAAIEARVTAIATRRDDRLAEINAALAGLGSPTATDRLAAEAQLAEVQRRSGAARDAQTAIGHDRQTIDDQLQPAIDREAAGVERLFASLGLDTRDDLAVRELCGRVAACRDAQAALDEARVVEQTRRHALAGAADASDLAAMRPAEIRVRLDASRAKAAGRDGVVEQIFGLDHELSQARGQTALEEAVAHEGATLDALRDARDRDDAQAAGWHVAEFIQRASRDQNRPAVFVAARTLFSQFTAGAWKLEMSGANDPSFVAVETSTDRHCTLADLSSGTRVQLLMAVRIAFIEASESGPQLPLILDETLGNADDARANAIIDATVEIARRGRQIVYFTAQNDEIAKWRGRMAQVTNAPDRPGTPELALIDLAAARGVANASQAAGIAWGEAAFEPFRLPDDATHESVREALGVPPVDLWAAHVGGVDLWYLVPDLSVLALLRQAGVTTWGQYAQLRQHEGLGIIAAFAEVDARIDVRLRVIDTVRGAWQRDRPRPLTHAALRATGLITDRYEPAVTDLAATHGWDGADLIRALREQSIQGFRQNVVVKLEEGFRNSGHIVDETPLAQGMIRLLALSAMRDRIAEGAIDEAEIDHVLQCLGAA